MFSLSGEPRRRLGVWLFISLAARSPGCHPVEGERGRGATIMVLGIDRMEGDRKGGFESTQNMTPTRGIRAPSPRRKPDSATLHGILFLDPVLLAWKEKMNPEAELSLLIHTVSSFMTKLKGPNPMNLLLHGEPRMLFFTFGKQEPAWKNTKALGPGGSVTRSSLKLLARCDYLATPPAVHSRDGFP